MKRQISRPSFPHTRGRSDAPPSLRGLGGSDRRGDEADAVRVEIMLEARGALQRIGERNVAVGPHQVARVAGEPCDRIAGFASRLGTKPH